MKKLLVGVAIVVAGCADPVSVSGPHRLYQVSGEQIPTTSDQAKAYAIESDGVLLDGLGRAFAELTTQGFADPQAATDQVLMASHLGFTIDVQQPGGDQSPTPAAVNTYAGSAIAFDPSSPTQPALEGTADHALVHAGPGDLMVVLAPFGTPLEVPLHDARVQLIAGPEQLQAIITGGVARGTIDDVLIPSWVPVLGEVVARDCTAPTTATCGCATDSPGANAVQNFDANHDCTITADELVHSYWVQTFTTFEETIDGVQLLAFGFALDATFVRTVP